MALLMLHQGRKQLLLREEGVVNGADRLISQLQLLPLAGALVVGLRRILRQRPAVTGPVVDQHRSHLTQPPVEVRQGGQQLGVVAAVPENAGLVLIEPVVFRQCLPVPGPQLAEGQVHEPTAGGSPLPDEHQILRGEEHGVQHVGEGGVVLGGNAVDTGLTAAATEQLHLRAELPVPCKHLPQDVGLVPVEADELPVRSGPWRLAAGEIDHGLQQIRLALSILAVDDVAAVVEGQGLPVVVAEALQRQGVNPHSARRSAGPQPPRRRLGGAFFPAGCRPRR